jgi:hypothetical protein
MMNDSPGRAAVETGVNTRISARSSVVIGPRLVARWIVATVVGAVLAIPTRLVANGWFRRMTPTRPQDHAFWVIASVLLGATIALRREANRRVEASVAGGGIGTFLAIGCPICNKLVVGLLGTAGALNFFAPLQPLLGVGSLALIAWGLRVAWRNAEACPLPEMAPAS